MIRRLLLAGLIAGLLSPTAVLAGRGDAVDPGLMVPPLNPSFGPWECWRTGDGITCEGERTIVREAEENGLVCDAGTVYTDEIDHRTQRRYGTADGLALKTIQHVDIRGTMSVDPGMDGPLLYGAGHFTETFEYGVPGDLSTRTDRYTGVDGWVRAPGLGLIIAEVGIKMFDIDGELLLSHGWIPFTEDFDAAAAKLCDAFAALGA